MSEQECKVKDDRKLFVYSIVSGLAVVFVSLKENVESLDETRMFQWHRDRNGKKGFGFNTIYRKATPGQNEKPCKPCATSALVQIQQIVTHAPLVRWQRQQSASQRVNPVKSTD